MNLQDRISYKEDLKALFTKVCKDYDLGKFEGFEIIATGYEDFNVVISSSTGKYFVKIFNSGRSKKECKRYVEIVNKVIEAGVSHPKLYEDNQGKLYSLDSVYLCVMEYVKGKTFLELERNPTKKEREFIIEQAALINSIVLHPDFVYDSWAIPNFLKEYRKKGSKLNSEDRKLIDPLVEKFKLIKLDSLPHGFVHGAIEKMNIIKDKNGKIFIIDFSTANYYPRIIELAVLLSDLFFNKLQKEILDEYQKHTPLTTKEIEVLPLFEKFGCAMYLLRANYEKVVNGNNSKETDNFIKIGRIGLEN